MNLAAISWWREGIIYQIIQGRFKTRMATKSAICPGSPVLCAISASMRFGYRRSLTSPMVDFGYDISNYLGVDPIFGSLDDFDALVAAAHASNLKVILERLRRQERGESLRGHTFRSLAGDRIVAGNCFQHAEHYFRSMAEYPN
jgi:hypothetical protein